MMRDEEDIGIYGVQVSFLSKIVALLQPINLILPSSPWHPLRYFFTSALVHVTVCIYGQHPNTTACRKKRMVPLRLISYDSVLVFLKQPHGLCS